MSADEVIASFDSCGVPQHDRDSLLAYCLERRPCGGFLTAVLENDLQEACAHADNINRHALFEIVQWLYEYAPASAWGSPAKVTKWLERSQS